MKILLTTLNAKFIHTSLALRWLYVANKERYNITFKEYIIKEKVETITEEILASGCDILSISVYIWNVKKVGQLVATLKKRKPNLIILVGGPEVMYEPQYFLKEWEIDFVVSGEGEFVLGELFHALENKLPTTIPGVSSRASISEVVVQADLEQLAKLPSPYQLEEDIPFLPHRMVYFESSRGCPYQCQYCLSSLEKGVRYFPKSYIVENLKYLIEHGAKQIKFLDRTFNLNKSHTKTIFDFLLANHRANLSCQFEIYADLLKPETISYLNNTLPKNYFRFEVGIQSTYEPTNLEVKRRQDFDILSQNITHLMEGGKVDLHLDLIAGLPFETFDRFIKSFNDVFALRAKEVQLGFLKMLRGTNLRKNAKRYGYHFDQEAPYEILYNDTISRDELDRIHDAEHALEKFWNSGRFSQTMNTLFDSYYKGKYFELFDEIGQYYNLHHLPHHAYQLEDLFSYLHAFLLERGIDLFPLLRNDYYNNFTLRPHGFWKEKVTKKEKKKLFRTVAGDKKFLAKHKIEREEIVKRATIDLINEKELLITLFRPRVNKRTPHQQYIYQKK